MEIKRYRAATMRAALEQVKQELGADALVLETKEIRAGGFLGLGAKPAVELRVAAQKPMTARETGKKSRLSVWNEEEPQEDLTALKAATKPTIAPAAAKSNGFAAFAARTYANEAPAQASEARRPAPALPNAVAPSRESARTQGIEIATTPPQVVRPPAPPPATAPPAPSPAPRPAAPSPAATTAVPEVNGELARLRSEMRAEMRALGFSMNAMVARQVAYADSQEGAKNQLWETFEADPEIFDSPYFEIYSVLTAAGLRPELARGVVRAGKTNGSRQLRNFETLARAGLVATLPSIARFAPDPLAPMIGSAAAPTAIALVGPTGVGKTTTIAKLAAQVVCRLRRRVVLVTLDTYRIAATEQLRIYAEIIGAGYHIAHSVRELDTLVRRFSGGATVLIDTAGRSPSDLTDETELGNYLRECDDLLKMLVLPATTHPVDAHTAVRQFSIFGPNQLILTKMDETTRPGAAVSVAGDSGLPLAYLCSGQRVPEDLERATPLSFAARVVRASFAIQEF
ncbi:MAG TPA: flagellar biosynthesis protein FlhF [Blastocatellia bacterium]|nr:flagellar biosynthesis protein FlhF [Blastocatellia bacterium]